MADDKRYMGYWIGHLHEGERNRIHHDGPNFQESQMLAKGEDPWAKFRGPLPPNIPAYLPPSPPESDTDERERKRKGLEALHSLVPPPEKPKQLGRLLADMREHVDRQLEGVVNREVAGNAFGQPSKPEIPDKQTLPTPDPEAVKKKKEAAWSRFPPPPTERSAMADYLRFATGEERKWLEERSLSDQDHDALVAELQAKDKRWRESLMPSRQELLGFTTEENRKAIKFGRDTPELWQQIEADWRIAQIPGGGVRQSASSQEEISKPYTQPKHVSKVELAKLLRGEPLSDSSDRKTTTQKFVAFIESPLFLAGVGVIVATLALVFWGALFVLAAAFFMGAIIRADFFEHHRSYRFVGNIALCAIMAAVVFLFWYFVPNPFAKTQLPNVQIENQNLVIEGFLQFEDVTLHEGHSDIAVGERFGGKYSAENPGPTVVYNGISYGDFMIGNSDEEVRLRLEQEVTTVRERYLSDITKRGSEVVPEVGVGKDIWGTDYTEPLSSSDVDRIKAGTTKIYCLTWFAWRDKSGQAHEKIDCRWLQSFPAAPYVKGNPVWHPC